MAEQQKILIVEDDIALANAVSVNLKARGYAIQVATTAAAAITVASSWRPHAVLLDLGLPDVSGLDVLRSLRQWSSIPVIIVSARHDETGKINALDEGADDYVSKPFSIGELLARLRAALRRVSATQNQEQPVLTTTDGRVTIDLANTQVIVGGESVHLTPREWAILEYLANHRGQLVEKISLLQAVWGDNYERETNYLRVYVSQLRQKIEAEPSRPEILVTEMGIGYRLVI